MKSGGQSLGCGVVLALSLPACSPVARVPAEPAPVSHQRTPLSQAPLGAVRIERFGLTLPLPDAPRWQPVPGKSAWFAARHPASGATLRVRRWSDGPAPMRADRCEASARRGATLPDREGLALLDEQLLDIPTDFDTRIEVWVGPSADEQRRGVHGVVLAFGGWARGCFGFVFEVERFAVGAEREVGEILARVVDETLFGMVLTSPIEPPLTRDQR